MIKLRIFVIFHAFISLGKSGGQKETDISHTYYLYDREYNIQHKPRFAIMDVRNPSLGLELLLFFRNNATQRSPVALSNLLGAISDFFSTHKAPSATAWV